MEFPTRFTSLGVAAFLSASAALLAEDIRFNRDIRPILSDNCFHCHGPDEATREAELRLDLEGYAFEPHGKYDAAIIPGDAANSPLYQRLITESESEIMPPPQSHKSLTPDEIDLVRRWIDAGAEWEGHWAFEDPKKISPPDVGDWATNPIDAFIAVEHASRGLQPNPEADKPTLARRLSLDLTGLPPSPERVIGFVSDDSPDAYEKLVDDLLADPAYGEHQARFWLDAARYADTHGLHLDNYREIWPYRDWVVRAFNNNQPFDEFTIEQLAGDLLPNPTQDQLLATGFSRSNPTTSEGGAIDDEYKAIYAKDRAETAATVYLGLTVGCAACHDHKFDPISAKDFYQFSAFFNNIDGPIMDGNAYDTRPNLVMPRDEHLELWEAVSAEFEKRNKAWNQAKNAVPEETYEAWLAAEDRDLEAATTEVAWSTDLPEGTADSDTLHEVDLPAEIGTWGSDDAFTLLLHYTFPKLEEDEETLIASKFDGERGWRLYAIGGDLAQLDRYRIRFELISSLSRSEMIAITSKSRRYIGLGPNRSQTLAISYNGSGEASGLQLGYPQRLTIDRDRIVDTLAGDFANDAPLQVALIPAKESEKTEETEAEPKEKEARPLKFYASNVPLHRLEDELKVAQMHKIFATPREDWASREKRLLKAFYQSAINPETRAARDALAEVEPLYYHIYDRAIVSLIMKEKEQEAVAHILHRGEYDNKGEEVPANVPEALGGLPEGYPANRLGLAKWLVHEDNPLTARVTVNRLWQSLFGTGLVETSEDFGIMGTNPSHPELLDWLAIEFRENGWDMKDLLKQMVMTRTYRQDARIDPAEYAVDPDNRYLARGPRYRLDAEVIRDQALYVSGALRDEVGGAPVKPYQPIGLWDAVAYSGSNTRFYRADSGEGLYRRSLYTFWKRTSPPPSMTIFDAPSRETCSVRRERTNTPLQALALMNDPQYVEAARLLAERVTRPGGAVEQTPRSQIESMYRYAFGREAPDAHEEVLHASYLRFNERFAANPADAKSLVSTGHSAPAEAVDPVELASLTMVASQIMNLDSFLNKF